MYHYLFSDFAQIVLACIKDEYTYISGFREKWVKEKVN